MASIIHEIDDIFPGDSMMAQAMKAFDWTNSPLGDPGDWPDALKIPLRLLLISRFEMWLAWGPELIFFYNDAYIPTLGIKHGAALGQPLKTVWAEVYDEVTEQVNLVHQGKASWDENILMLLERSGFPEETYHSFSYSPLRGPDGPVCGVFCAVREDTARVIGERRLETIRQLGAALTNAGDMACIDHGIERVLGQNKRDFPFYGYHFFIHAEDGQRWCDGWDNAADAPDLQDISSAYDAAGQIIDLPATYHWPRGDWDQPPTKALAIAIPGTSNENGAGKLLLGLNPYRGKESEILEIARIIAAQIGGALANLAAMAAERRRADRMWSRSRDLVLAVDREGMFRSVSPSWTRILGHPVESVVGKNFRLFIHPDDLHPSAKALSSAFETENLSDFENRFRSLNGDYRSIAWNTSLEGDVIYAYGRDVTERRRVEAALSNSRQQFRHLVQSVTDYAICMIDLDGQVFSWNEGARRIMGYDPEEIIGQHFSRFYTDDDRARGEPAKTLEIARRDGRFLVEGWRRRKNGEEFQAHVVLDCVRNDHGQTIGFAKITRDISQREEAQRQLEVTREALAQSQKMDAIGQLTGGVAHDFNNLLMAVMSSLELLRKRLPDDPSLLRLMDTAFEGAKRGATLTQRMLAFARRQQLDVRPVDVPQLLAGMNDLVQRSIGPEWPISIRFPMELPVVRADANQLEMAVLNLIVNARDASPNGGPILITASREDKEEDSVAGLAAGPYVRLEVQDQGVGMDAETLRRATEPFFTTKGVGKGTGLGLPMVHGMTQQIGGAFELRSPDEKGVSAILWLPLAEIHESEADEEAAPAEEAVQNAEPVILPPPTPKLRVVAVDDDPLVLLNTVAMLEDLGHEAIGMPSAVMAMALFTNRDDIDLVVTDQAMPDMTGVDLLAALADLRPGLAAIIASGYGTGIEVPEHAMRLNKPFDQQKLAATIHLAMGYELPAVAA